jgi:rare lipoprotein A (peptidoglycan hydrolase)
LLVNVAITVALLPALFLGGSDGGRTAVAAGPGDLITTARSAQDLAASTTTLRTTTTTAAPAPPTTAAPRVVAAAATKRPATVRVTAHHATTTTTAKPRVRHTTSTTAAPRPAAAPAASGSESGKATWYDYKAGICAHKTLPFGTVVTVHAVNGKSVQCTVGDRGPYVDGYVIDLNQREFEQLAPTSAGRIDVTITW